MEILIGIGCFVGVFFIVATVSLFCIKGARNIIDRINTTIDDRYY